MVKVTTHSITAGDDSPKVISLYRGLRILDMFSETRRQVTIGEMANELGIHKSSASRLAATLAVAGYLRTTPSAGRYDLGSRLAALGPLAGQGMDISKLVTPFLEELSYQTGETSHLGVLRADRVRTVAVVDGWHSVRMHSWVGKEVLAHQSATGTAFLSGLSNDDLRSMYEGVAFERRTPNTVSSIEELIAKVEMTRLSGTTLDDEELEIGMRCLAAPVYSSDGSVQASLGISGPSSRLLLERIPLLIEHVGWAARMASAALGATELKNVGPEPAPLPWLGSDRPSNAPRH